MNRSFILALMATVVTLPAYGQSFASSLNQPLGESTILGTTGALAQSTPSGLIPLTAKKEEKPQKEGTGTTEITAREAAFDSKTNHAVFLGAVVVKNPQFNVNCDKLTAFLKKDGKEAAKPGADDAKTPAATPVATPAPSTPAQKKADDPSTGGLDKAIAEGSVVITQEKLDAEGKLVRNVGRSKRAVFDSNTGDITLTGNPQVEQGINTVIALEESTVMILNREGRMRVNGLHRSVIRDSAEANAR